MGSEIIWAGVISAVASIGAGAMASSATATAARNTAALQRAQADQQAAINRANADRTMIDADTMRQKEALDLAEKRRQNRILDAERKANAAAGGFEAAGTIGDLIDKEAAHDKLGETVLQWEWQNRILRKVDEANILLNEADFSEKMGIATAGATISSGDAQASSQFASGIFQGVGSAANTASSYFIRKS